MFHSTVILEGMWDTFVKHRHRNPRVLTVCVAHVRYVCVQSYTCTHIFSWNDSYWYTHLGAQLWCGDVMWYYTAYIYAGTHAASMHSVLYMYGVCTIGRTFTPTRAVLHVRPTRVPSWDTCTHHTCSHVQPSNCHTTTLTIKMLSSSSSKFWFWKGKRCF